jgi:hypothetical protein
VLIVSEGGRGLLGLDVLEEEGEHGGDGQVFVDLAALPLPVVEQFTELLLGLPRSLRGVAELRAFAADIGVVVVALAKRFCGTRHGCLPCRKNLPKDSLPFFWNREVWKASG